MQPSEDGGYVAISLGLPGCFTQGETLDQVRERIREAIAITLEDMTERGEKPTDPLIERIPVETHR